jgi:hypothetical protein
MVLFLLLEMVDKGTVSYALKKLLLVKVKKGIAVAKHGAHTTWHAYWNVLVK